MVTERRRPASAPTNCISARGYIVRSTLYALANLSTRDVYLRRSAAIGSCSSMSSRRDQVDCMWVVRAQALLQCDRRMYSYALPPDRSVFVWLLHCRKLRHQETRRVSLPSSPYLRELCGHKSDVFELQLRSMWVYPQSKRRRDLPKLSPLDQI